MDFAVQVRKCGLFLPMDAGKTAIAIHVIARLVASGFCKRVLIVAPIKVARKGWLQEFLKWGMADTFGSALCLGSIRERQRAIDMHARVTIINRENLCWLIERYTLAPWNMVVIDESSGFKSHSSARFLALAKSARGLKAVLLLSGTPCANSLMDLWAQLYLLDQGERLGRNITAYRRRYFYQHGIFGKYLERRGAREEIVRKISDICVFTESGRTTELPGLRVITVNVKIPPDAVTLYRTMRRHRVVRIGGHVVIANNAAVLIGKLSQIANGAVLVDKDRNYQRIHDAKISALRTIRKERVGQSMMVAYSYVSDSERLLKAFPEACKLDTKGEKIDAWNKGDIPMLLVQPMSTVHGLNAQYGGSVIVWFGLPWSLDAYKQTVGRLQRRGQSEDVTVIHLLGVGTVDYDMAHVLEQKESRQSNVLRGLIRRYR